jgi:ribulose-5-phosphate 4-epimerase/fuculose-1-phosphate aldolase
MAAMKEQEGVIKYQLTHHDCSLNQIPMMAEINSWRSIFCRLKIMGQVAERYQGFGFGNISHREDSGFIITGTQTGHLSTLTTDNYALVTKVDLANNQLQSQGRSQPSSEALTHASLYAQNKNTHAVIHVHCPEIWRQTQKLQLPYTKKSLPYGTPEMARAVMALCDTLKGNVFTMLGHQDGVIAFGENLQTAAQALLAQLTKALTIEQGHISG